MKYMNIFIYIFRHILAYPIFIVFYEFNKKFNLIQLSESSKEFFLILSFIMAFSQIIKFLIIKRNKDKIYDDELAKFIQFERENREK